MTLDPLKSRNYILSSQFIFRKIYTLQGLGEVWCHNKIEMIKPELIERHISIVMRSQSIECQLQQVVVVDWVDWWASQLHAVARHGIFVGNITPKINKINVLHRHNNQLWIAHFHTRDRSCHVPAPKSSQLHYDQLVREVLCWVLTKEKKSTKSQRANSILRLTNSELSSSNSLIVLTFVKPKTALSFVNSRL